MKQLRTISDANILGKKIFVRVDFNVPMLSSKIIDDRKIVQSLPTIQALLESGAHELTLATHFSKTGQKVGPIREYLKKVIRSRNISLLDNLRLDQGEERNDMEFAGALSQGHNLYVNDAFAVCHRSHASVVAITKFLPAYAGFLIEKEVTELSKLNDKAPKPFLVIMGGAKSKDKLPIIKKMSKIADKVLLGGKTGIDFKLQNSNAKLRNILPLVDDIDGKDIGPKTIKLFKKELAGAKTVFWNGNMGKSEEEKYAKGTFGMAKFIVKLNATTYVGGGDTVAVIDKLKLAEKFTFVSTGGGATLEFLASGGNLPGLKPLYK